MEKRHFHKLKTFGANFPRLYGSFATEICECGAWRKTTHLGKPVKGEGWRKTDLVKALTKARIEMEEM